MDTLAKRRLFLRLSFTTALVFAVTVWMSSSPAFSKEPAQDKTFRAGVAAVDISPAKLPVISSGSFLTRSGSHLGLGGNWQEKNMQGRLIFYNGDEKHEVLTGGPVIEPKTWNHVRMVRQGDEVHVYLNFEEKPIISGRASITRPQGCSDVFIGGRSDNFANFEGRIADAALYCDEAR